MVVKLLQVGAPIGTQVCADPFSPFPHLKMAFLATGYENAYGAAGFTATPSSALTGWKNSPAHNEVILNNGMQCYCCQRILFMWCAGDWASAPHGPAWPAMGAGISGGFAVLWFGDATDTQVPLTPYCNGLH
jgi:hypothetical protein